MKNWDMRKPTIRIRLNNCGFRWGTFFGTREHNWKNTTFELMMLAHRIWQAKGAAERAWHYGYREGWKNSISLQFHKASQEGRP